MSVKRYELKRERVVMADEKLLRKLYLQFFLYRPVA